MTNRSSADRVDRLLALRLRRHRLHPSRPIRDARGALAFLRERRIVLSTGHSSLPVVAEAIAGHPLRGSWMANPEVFRIYNILKKVHASTQVVSAPLILGKETLLDASLGPSVVRIAADPRRRDTAISGLPPLAQRLLRQVEVEGEVRMDRLAISTAPGRTARLLLERELLIVSRDLHTERGHHTAVVMPWSRSTAAARFARRAMRLTYDEACDALVLAAVRSAVIAPEREVRRWFVFGDDRVASLIAEGLVTRVRGGRAACLAYPQ